MASRNFQNYQLSQGLGKDKNSFPLISEQVKWFYIDEMHKILKSFKRGKILSFILISIYFIQLLGLLLSSQMISKLSEASNNSNFFIKTSANYGSLTSNTYYSSSSEAFNKERQFLIGATILCLILELYILFRLCWYILRQNRNDNQLNNQTLINNIPNHAIINNIFDKIISFIFRIFIYVLFLPFCELSLKISLKSENSQYRTYFDMIIGSFTLISSLMIAILIQYQEYDYSLILKDHLSQQRSFFRFLSLQGDTISCFLLLFDSLAVQQIFHFINNLLRIAFLLIKLPFNSKRILTLFIQQSAFILLVQICFLISSFSSSQKISFSICLLTTSPLCYILGKWINKIAIFWNSYNLPFLQDNIQLINPKKLEIYIRNSLELFSLPFEDYLKNGLGMKFETIFANHLSTCQNSFIQEMNLNVKSSENLKLNIEGSCFCIKFRDKQNFQNKFDIISEKQQEFQTLQMNFSSSLSLNLLEQKIPQDEVMNRQQVQKEISQKLHQIIGRKYRKAFIIQYFEDIFKIYFTSSNKNKLDHSLLIKPTFIYFLLQIVKSPLKAYQQIAFLKEQMKKSSLQSKALLKEIIDDIKEYFSLFISESPFQNSRLAISAVFTFDNLCKEFKTSLKEGIQMKQHFYEFLYSDFINLNELLFQSNSCLSFSNILTTKIQNLFDINPNDSNLLDLAELYLELFVMKKRNIKNLIKLSKQLTNKKLNLIDLKIDIFDSTSCAFFLSLHSKKITYASNSIQNFFSQNTKDLIGQEFTSIFPNFVSIKFDYYLKNLLDEGNQNLMKIGEFFTFIKSSSNPIIVAPVFIRSKIDSMGDSDFGISMLLSPCDSHKMSIITDKNSIFLAFTSSAHQLLTRFIQSDIQGEMVNSLAKGKDNIFKSLNIKNFIPFLFCLDDKFVDKINSLKGYNENQGYKDQRTQKFQTYRSLLVLPTCKEDFNLLNQKIELNSISLSTYFNTIFQGKFQFYDITFSFLSFNFPKSQSFEKQIDIISHKQIHHSQEIKDLVSILQMTLSSRFAINFTFQLDKSVITRSNYQQNQESIKKAQCINEQLFDLEIKNQYSKSRNLSKESRKDELIDVHNSHQQIFPPEIEADSPRKQNAQISQQKNISPSHSSNLFLSTPKERDSTASRLLSQSSYQFFKKDRGQQIDDFIQKKEFDLTDTQRRVPQIKTEPMLKRVVSDELLLEGQISDLREDYYLISQQEKIPNIENQINRALQSNLIEEINKNNLINERIEKFKFEDNDDAKEIQSQERGKQINQPEKIKVQKFNTTRKSQREDIHKIRTNNQIKEDSIRTGKNSIFSKQQIVLDLIIHRRDPFQITFSKIIGGISFIAIIIITFILFFQIKNNFDKQWTNFMNLLIGPQISESIQQVLRIKELLTFIYVGDMYHYLVSSFSTTLKEQYTQESLVQLDKVSKVLGNLESYHITDGFEDFLLNNRSKVLYSNTQDIYQLQILYFSIWQFLKLQLSEKKFNYLNRYSLIQYPINLKMYLQFNEIFGRSFVYLNCQSFLQTNLQLIALSTEQAINKLEQTEFFLYINTVIIEIICICGLLMVFPIYYMIQIKREDILKLLATLDPNELRQLISKFKMSSQLKCLSLQKSSDNKFKPSLSIQQILNETNIQNFDNYSILKNQNQSKKRKISSTNQLPKYSTKLIVLSLVIFIIISLYSLLNFLMNRSFFKNFQYNIDELSFITQTSSYISSNYCEIYFLSNSYAYKLKNIDIYTIQSIFYGKKNLKEDNQERILKIEQIEENFIENRFQMSEYQQYFLNIINKDACPILSSPYSMTALQNNPIVNINLCETINGGLLSQGLTVALKDFYQKMLILNNNYVSNQGNSMAYFMTFKKWDYENNLKEFDLSYYYIRAILQSQIEFLITQSKKQFNILMNVQDALFIYFLISITLVYLVIWRKFLQQMSSSIQSSTELLSLIPIQYLIKNSYVMSYLNKQKNQHKIQY